MKMISIRKTSLVIILALLLTIPSRAQILIVDGQSGLRRQADENIPFIPVLGVSYDQYAPLEEGMLLLIVFVASYGYSKRKKNT